MTQVGNKATSAQEHHKRPSSATGGRRSSRDTQFKPGTSGNARGRPQGAKGRKQIVREIAAETHEVVENGKKRRLSTLDLVLLSIRNCAATGDASAFRVYHELLQRYAPQEIKDGPTGLVILSEDLTEEEWIQRAEEAREREKRADR
jgi:Family of unknown function (DUF5681)